MERVLREYQSKGIDTIAYKTSLGKKKVIFQLATGGGKTVCFAGLVNRYLAKQQKKVLILVHREELLRQALRTLFDWYEISAAPVTADTTYLPNVMVYVAMVETANNRLKKNSDYFGNVGLVIVDECHIGNFKKIYEYFQQNLIIGFTATPISSSKHDPLKDHFEDIVCGIDIPDLIAEKSLVPNKTFHIRNVNRKDLKLKNGEFDEAEMGRVYSSSKHVHNCIAAYQHYCLGKKTLIFNCNIEHSKKVNAAFQSYGYPSRHLDGETPMRERAETLLWFKNTPDAILHNVGVLTTGFDEPSVQAVVVNKSTKALPLWLQMTGRGARLFLGKEFFTIVDMGGNALEHGDWSFRRDWSDMFFNPDKPKEGGEAPVKVCIGCEVLIHASCKMCPLCGADNYKAPAYDETIIQFEQLTSDRPWEIDVPALLQEHSDKKDYYSLHQIKIQLINHATRYWHIRKLTDQTAAKLHRLFQEKVKQWCDLKGKRYNQWHKDTTSNWLSEEMKRVFKYEPKKVSNDNGVHA